MQNATTLIILSFWSAKPPTCLLLGCLFNIAPNAFLVTKNGKKLALVGCEEAIVPKTVTGGEPLQHTTKQKTMESVARPEGSSRGGGSGGGGGVGGGGSSSCSCSFGSGSGSSRSMPQ